MYASTDTRTQYSRGAVIPAPAAAAPLSVIDITGTCGCGQELDTRHVRCTRCGR